MQIKELLLGIPVVIFVFWVFTAPLPQERIARVCEPISWVGNLATSSTALVSDEHTKTSARWSDKMNYSCQYLIWRLFYQADYIQAVQDGRIAPTSEQAEQLGEQETLTAPKDPTDDAKEASNPELDK